MAKKTKKASKRFSRHKTKKRASSLSEPRPLCHKFKDFYKKNCRHFLLYTGIILGIAVPLMVFFFPYSHYFFLAWLAALTIIGFYFFKGRRIKKKAFDLKDVIIFAGIILSLSSLYLLSLDSSPMNIDVDELNILYFVSSSFEEDSYPFYPAYYGYYAKMNFMLYAMIIDAFGDINFENLRMVVAFVGLLSAGMTYFLFRLFSSRLEAIIGAVLLGVSHVHIGYSRIGLLNNMVVLLTVLAALFFLHGWLRKERWSIFVGGLFIGLGWYTYAIGRFIIILAVVFFGLYILANRFRVDWKLLLKLGSVIFLGFLLVVAPFLAASLKISEDKHLFGGDGTTVEFVKNQIILSREGMEEQKRIKEVDTYFEAFLATVWDGARLFNYHEPRDYDLYVYDFYRSPSGGLVDFLTGILIWIGLAAAVLTRKFRDVAIFFAGSFFSLWLFFSFVVMTPFQARTLIFFPFVAYFASQGIFFISDKVSERFNAKFLRSITVLLLFLAVVSLNLKNYSDSVAYDAEFPNDIGVIYRDLLSKSSDDSAKLFIIAKYYDYLPIINDWEKSYVLYGDYYDFWNVDPYLRKDQELAVIDVSKPFDLNRYNERTATLYTTARLYSGKIQEQFESKYEVKSVRPLAKSRDIIAIELMRLN